MLPNRIPLLWAFAGGCLSGGTLIGIGVGIGAAGTASPDAPEARTAPRHRAPPAAAPANDGAELARATDDRDATQHSAPPKTTPAMNAESPAEGSSLADILAGLEVAYRQSVASAPPHPPAASAHTPPREVPAHEPAAREEPAVAAAAPSTPQANAPVAAASPAAVAIRAPEVDARRLLALQSAAPPRDVHVGDVHQNTTIGTVNENVGSVHQGDVYLVPNVGSYVPYFPLTAAGVAASGYVPRSSKPRYAVPDVPLPSSVTARSGSSPFRYPVDLVH